MEKITIKQIRVGLDMNQKEMADFLGLSRESYISRETGKLKFSFEEVKKICDKAGVSLDSVKI